MKLMFQSAFVRMSLIVFLLGFCSRFFIVTSEVTNEDLIVMSEALNVRQWYFLTYEREDYKSLAYNLARHGRLTLMTESFVSDYCRIDGTVIMTKLSIFTVLDLIEDDFPRCSWIILDSFKNDFSERLPVTGQFVGFLDDGLLTLVRKPCLKCQILIKTAEIATVSLKTQINEFMDLSFLNNSILDVSHDEHQMPTFSPKFEPFMLIQCYQYEILEMVYKKHNFGVNLVHPLFPGHRYNFPNGSEGGFLIQLEQRLVDLSVTSLVATEARLNKCDSVFPTFELKAGIFVKAARNEIIWLGYLYPFNRGIWLAIIVAILAGTAVIILITSYARYINKQRPVFVLFPFFFSLQLFCLQGLTKIQKITSLRIAYFSLLISAGTILPVYSGSIVSFLTINRAYFPFSTLNEFIANGRFQILTRAPHFIDSYLQTSKLTNLTALWYPEKVTNDQSGFDKLCEVDGLAYIIEDILYKPALREYNCPIMETPVVYTKEYFSIMLPKNSPFTESIKIATTRAKSAGLQNRLKNILIQETRPMNVDANFNAVYFNQIAPLVIFLAFFIFVGCVILCLEKLINSRFKRIE